ncbi:MAG: hypothetical protein ACOWWO_08190 [Peptococcaceae bacterium]
MSLPSRKTRRRNKLKGKIKIKPKVFMLLLVLILINLLMMNFNNYALLLFIVPGSIIIFLYAVLKTNTKILLVNILIILFIYFTYLEMSYRLWAQK